MAVRCWCLCLILFSLALAQDDRQSQVQPLGVDTITTEVLAEPNPHWVWVLDVNFLALMASRAMLVDGDSLTVLGSISSGLTPNLEVSPDGKEIYMIETYYTRGTRGERQDLVAVYDGQTLAHKADIEIPYHLSVVSKRPVTALSPDGRFLAVFNMRPATSVSIIDLSTQSVIGEFETPGCYMVTAIDVRRFMMFCGDGSLQTIVIDDAGQLTSKTRSEAIINVENDPVFEHTTMLDGDMYLLSYKGMIHQIDLAGESPSLVKSFSLTTEAEAGWMPGGWQLISGYGDRLYVLMDERPVDTHKYPSSQVWIYDLSDRAVVQKITLEMPAQSVMVTQDENPLLFALGVLPDIELIGVLQSYDALSGEFKGMIDSVGVTPYLLMGYQP